MALAHRAFELRPETLLKLLQETDALRQPQRFEQFLQACDADACGAGRLRKSNSSHKRICCVQALKTRRQSMPGRWPAVRRPGTIKERVHQARLAALKQWRQTGASCVE